MAQTLYQKKTDSDTAFYLYNGHADVTALMGEKAYWKTFIFKK